MPVKMSVRGFAELEKELELLEEKVQKRIIQKALRKAANEFAFKASQTAPVSEFDKDNLVLSESIIATSRAPTKDARLDNKEHTATMYVGVEKSIWYAHFVHNGTVKASPNPFLESALIREKENIVDDIQTFVWQEIQKKKS